MGRLFIYVFGGYLVIGLVISLACAQKVEKISKMSEISKHITLFMAGDVMTGRGIDQILPHPSDPAIYEPYVKDARDYVALAEKAHGPIHIPVEFSYIWGDALEVLDRMEPDLRLINLETSITDNSEFWPGKGIQYRMHPANIDSLIAAGIDYCSLANNHVLDWHYKGLFETLETLTKANILYSGAGRNQSAAIMPAVFDIQEKGRVVIFSWGSEDSGIPRNWAALHDSPGVNLLPDLSSQTIAHIKAHVAAVKKPRDVIVASIHWGSNWGDNIPARHTGFAHRLIDEAGVDLIYGHSSHHFRPLEVYKGKLIIYGAGDFLNDYEGISGYESFRPELALMYFARVDPATGKLTSLEMIPTHTRKLKVNMAAEKEARWLQEKMNKVKMNSRITVELSSDSTLMLKWD